MLANFPPTLRLDFMGTALDSRLTFARAGTAYYFDASGVMQSAGTDVPRLGAYALNSGQPYGLLLENAVHVNIAIHSRDFTITRDVVVSGGSGTFIDGETVNATGGGTGTYIADESVAATFALRAASGTFTGTLAGVSSGATRTLGTVTTRWAATNVTVARDQTGLDNAANRACSLTATANNGTVLQARTTVAADRISWACVKRITGTGTVEMTQDGGATWTAISIAGAWKEYRIPLQNVTNPSYGFRLATSGDAIAVDLFHNVQVGSTGGDQPSSPIPTTTANVSTVADTLDIASLGSWFNPAEGTVLCRVYRYWNDDTFLANNGAVSFNDGTNNNRIGVTPYVSSTGKGNWFVIAGGATQANLTPGVASSSDAERTTVGSYKVNSFQSAQDGQLTTRDVSGSIPTVDRASFGRSSAAGGLACLMGIREVLYWNRAHPDGFMAARSA